MDEVVRYSYRLRPGRAAECALLAEWHRCRFLWNEAVNQQKSGRAPTFGTLSKLLTDARSRSAWLREGSQVAQQIAVEDFEPKFLAKSTMARKAADAAIDAAKRELIGRGTRAGRKVVLVQPAHTTMTCSSCFARAKQRLGLAERIFRCHGCGYTDGRDRNAASVILAVAERGHTRADDVRQSDHLLRAAGSVAV